MKRDASTPFLAIAGIVLMLGGSHGTIPAAPVPVAGSSDTVAYGETNGRIFATPTPLAPVIVTARDERWHRAALDMLRDGAPGTYIDEILAARDSAITRWRVGTRPLRVWIQPTAEIPDFTADHPRLVREAFAQWDSVGLGGLHFRFVSDSTRADVHVTWIDRFSDPISGRTRWARDSNWWMTRASIVIAVHHHRGETLGPDATRVMALHEVGHLIGLDHTSDPNSVMAPRVRVRRLSERDQATARLMYSLPAGALR